MKNYFGKNYLLILLLFVTLLKGVLWSFSVPLFQAPDEQAHYATIQAYALPKGYQPRSNDFQIDKLISHDINTQNLSPELRNFLVSTDFERIRFRPDNQMIFKKNSRNGLNEASIRSGAFSRFVEKFPPWKVPYGSVYYAPMSWIENLLHNQSNMERFFAIRLFSVLLGTLLVLCSYFIFLEVFQDKTESAILAGIVSFQPMLTFINSSVNVDPLLFLSFAIFLLGSVRILKNKIGAFSLICIIAGMTLGILTKPPGYFMPVILPILALFYLFIYHGKKFAFLSGKKMFLGAFLFIAAAGGTAYAISRLYFPNILRTLSLVPKYLQFELKYQPSLERSLSYWGNFGWVDTNLSRFLIFSIWILSILVTIGIVKYFLAAFFSKSQKNAEKDRVFFFQLLYFLIFVAGVSAMIHFVNLQFVNPNNVADQSGSISTQGRYFFPSLIPRLALMAFGFACLFPGIRRRYIFMLLLLGMVFLNTWSLLVLVIPRYYL